jgi:pyridoxal phosphate enzyme (YggS family)
MLSNDEIARRWVDTRRRLDERSSGVVLVAVTKTFPCDSWAAVVRAGGHDVGENYAQELLAKSQEYSERFPDLPRPRVHFIGRLQSNKVRGLSSAVDLWQTVDRASLIDEIARWAPGAHLLVQVNATGEADKGGCPPEEVASLVAAARGRGLVVEGLMVVGPTDGDSDRTRRAFAVTARLADREGLSVRSMGMSADLDTALAEGSTMVRVGSALFGDRPPVG